MKNLTGKTYYIGSQRVRHGEDFKGFEHLPKAIKEKIERENSKVQKPKPSKAETDTEGK
jgi:hypothetical protein